MKVHKVICVFLFIYLSARVSTCPIKLACSIKAGSAYLIREMCGVGRIHSQQRNEETAGGARLPLGGRIGIKLL